MILACLDAISLTNRTSARRSRDVEHIVTVLHTAVKSIHEMGFRVKWNLCH